jgi:hypothetical protein
MLIKRVYEVDPLCCPKCGGMMKIISFIERNQSEVIEKDIAPSWPLGRSDPRAAQRAQPARFAGKLANRLAANCGESFKVQCFGLGPE